MALFYTYFGYPLYQYLRSGISRRDAAKDVNYKPKVSIVFSAYNEEDYVLDKIENLLKSDYPGDRLEILACSDGSTDSTGNLLSGIKDNRVKAFVFEKRRGKPSVLNDIVPLADGEIVVLCDVRQKFDKDAVSQLVSNFADNRIGCVSGELIFIDAGSERGISDGIGLYWEYEKFIRRCESNIHSMVGATGAIYAIRKYLYVDLPADVILDDVYIPLSIVRKGYRSIFDPSAKAYDRPATTPAGEYRRKVRTLAGNYQIFRFFPGLFIPLKNHMALALFSHKFLRLLAPFSMIMMFLSNLFMAKESFYGSTLVCQVIFYILAILGSMTYRDADKRLFVRIASTAYAFCLMNFTAIIGLYRYLFGKQKVAWEK